MSTLHKNAVNEYLVQTGFDPFNKVRVQNLENRINELEQEQKERQELTIHLHFLEEVLWEGIDNLGTKMDGSPLPKEAIVGLIHQKMRKKKQQILYSLQNSKDKQYAKTQSSLLSLLQDTTKYIESVDTEIVNALYNSVRKEEEIKKQEEELNKQQEELDEQVAKHLAFIGRHR